MEENSIRFVSVTIFGLGKERSLEGYFFLLQKYKGTVREVIRAGRDIQILDFVHFGEILGWKFKKQRYNLKFLLKMHLNPSHSIEFFFFFEKTCRFNILKMFKIKNRVTFLN